MKGKESDINELNRGNHTKNIIDLNRVRVNAERYRDNLPGKRGKKYKELQEDWEYLKYYQFHIRKLRTEVLPLVESSQLPSIEGQIKVCENEFEKYKRMIAEATKNDAEFAGLCRWYSQQPGRQELMAS